MIDTSDEQRTIVLDDGAQTIVERWGAAGPIVLCVHGMTSSRKSWERTALHLRDRFRVIAYDQRGHGDSARVTGPMTIERAVRDLENVVASLGETPFALLGHSWGGAVVISAGRSLPVRRVAAIDPGLRQLPGQWYREMLAEIAPMFALVGAARDAYVREDYAAWPEIDRERKVHAVAKMTLEPLHGLRDQNDDESWNVLPALVAYPKPLLLALADPAETIVAPDDLARIEREGADKVKIVVFKGEGHNLHRMAFERFAAELDGFLG